MVLSNLKLMWWMDLISFFNYVNKLDSYMMVKTRGWRIPCASEKYVMIWYVVSRMVRKVFMLALATFYYWSVTKGWELAMMRNYFYGLLKVWGVDEEDVFLMCFVIFFFFDESALWLIFFFSWWKCLVSVTCYLWLMIKVCKEILALLCYPLKFWGQGLLPLLSEIIF